MPLETDPPAASPATDPLRLTICPACGYSLEGLPGEGVCPECGGEYDQSAVILHGSARGALAHLANAGWRPILGLMGVAGFQLYNLSLVSGGPRSKGVPWLPWILVAYFAAGVVVLIGRRLSHAAPGLVRVRLDPEGCCQQDAEPGTSVWAMLLRWWQFGMDLLLPLWLLCWVGLLIWPGLRATTIGAMTLTVALLVGLWWSTRPPEEKARLAALVWHGRRRESRARWASVAKVHLDPLGGGRFRLRLRGPGSWRTSVQAFVDAEVHCTPAQAEALRARIHEWRRAKGWARQ